MKLSFYSQKDTLYDTHKTEATFAHTDMRLGKVTQYLSSTKILSIYDINIGFINKIEKILNTKKENNKTETS